MKNYKKYSGKKIGGYTIEGPVGEGRYGLCFKALSYTGEKVIIKKFKNSIFKRNFNERVHEAVVLSNLKHKCIPEILGVINEKGFYGFVLQYMEGYTVREMLFKKGYKFSKEEIYSIGIKLIEIIVYLHNNKIVHGDISISNVMINENNVFLIDFGLARKVDNNYSYVLDYSYLGDFLLYLIYSSYEIKQNYKNNPWYEELVLTSGQKLFLKRLLGIEPSFKSIGEVNNDFIKEFK